MIYKSIYDEFEGWVSVDISDLQMSVDEDIIVGIEWIEHSKNGKNLSLPMIVPSLGSTHFIGMEVSLNGRDLGVFQQL